MDIKYTLEILTKDIQDIEKLVGNLQNSPEGSALELDLALSKLRNVYDILTIIRTDMTLAGRSHESEHRPPVAEKESRAVKDDPQAETKEPAPPISAEIIAEKFETESSINENMAATREPKMDSKLIGQPIESIGRNIGINDRFLIIRELFDGNSSGFAKLVEDLDKAGSLKAANQLLENQFEHADDHEGLTILANLVKRKYNRI